jgi:hypothetical protein
MFFGLTSLAERTAIGRSVGENPDAYNLTLEQAASSKL